MRSLEGNVPNRVQSLSLITLVLQMLTIRTFLPNRIPLPRGLAPQSQHHKIISCFPFSWPFGKMTNIGLLTVWVINGHAYKMWFKNLPGWKKKNMTSYFNNSICKRRLLSNFLVIAYGWSCCLTFGSFTVNILQQSKTLSEIQCLNKLDKILHLNSHILFHIWVNSLPYWDRYLWHAVFLGAQTTCCYQISN